MDFFGVLSLIGGLAMFLLGMNLMGSYLEKRAGSGLKTLLSKLTSNPLKGLLLGLGVTAVIQSSSATTVMVVGFVNSGIMSLHQAISIIMGANNGTTVTSWILSLSGIESSNIIIQMFKPVNFTPILALIGTVLTMASKKDRHKDTGMILLGCAVLMYGMDMMSAAVAPLKDSEAFCSILTLFTNPVLGVLAGAVLTGIIQSSSASVGILQAISSTGAITYGSAIPIIMGQNIGTCVTAMISSIGENKNARRAAMVHLYFNIVGSAVWLAVYLLADALIGFAFTDSSINQLGVAVVHSVFNVLSTALLFPFGKQLEKLATLTVRDGSDRKNSELDERLFVTPAIALNRAWEVVRRMASVAQESLNASLGLFDRFDAKTMDQVIAWEKKTDEYEDMIGDYLVKLSARDMSESDSCHLSSILHVISDFERIGDHALALANSAQEMHDKNIAFSGEARQELSVTIAATREALDMATDAFVRDDALLAANVEPLTEVIENLKETIRSRHIVRLTQGECTIELGFVLTDILGDLERVSGHASNVAVSVLDRVRGEYDDHAYLGQLRGRQADSFVEKLDEYSAKYAIRS